MSKRPQLGTTGKAASELSSDILRLMDAATALSQINHKRLGRILTGSGAGLAITVSSAEYFAASAFHPWSFLVMLFLFMLSLFLAFYADSRIFRHTSYLSYLAGGVLPEAGLPQLQDDRAEVIRAMGKMSWAEHLGLTSLWVLFIAAGLAFLTISHLELSNTETINQPTLIQAPDGMPPAPL